MSKFLVFLTNYFLDIATLFKDHDNTKDNVLNRVEKRFPKEKFDVSQNFLLLLCTFEKSYYIHERRCALAVMLLHVNLKCKLQIRGVTTLLTIITFDIPCP